ncbi:MAG: crossover junction endodeoxyribonuclease RuvC [Myxococcota bacterium]
MRVLGIDPGTLKLGWGVVERAGTRVRHIAHGTLRMPPGELADRLVYLDAGLAEVVATHAPDEAAVESIFFSKNASSAAKLGHARGVVLLGLRRGGLPVGEYPPATVKRAVVGRGRADKHQVARIVESLLRLDAPPQEDAADALAVAITHLHTARFARHLARARR